MRHALTICLMLLAAGAASAGDCSKNVLGIGGELFVVAIADDAQERAQGLMGVREMPDRAGMLFVFPAPVEVSFWMKDTHLPLDMVFIAEDGRVARIHENAVPHDLTSIRSGEPVRYVLELNGGVSARIGIETGDLIVSPVIGTGCAARTEEMEKTSEQG